MSSCPSIMRNQNVEGGVKAVGGVCTGRGRGLNVGRNDLLNSGRLRRESCMQKEKAARWYLQELCEKVWSRSSSRQIKCQFMEVTRAKTLVQMKAKDEHASPLHRF